jgi:hypothetical protein
MVALILSAAACSSDAPSQVQINLTAGSISELSALTARATTAETVTLPAVTIDALLDGEWKTISDAPRNIELSLGQTPAPTVLLQKALPMAALTGLRLHVSHEGKHVDLSADCLGRIPHCAGGKIDLVLQNPRACLDGDVGSAMLQIVAFDLTPGQCGPPPPPPDLSSSDADTACIGVVCPPDQVCRGGSCFPSDSCNNVVCPPGQTCENGSCVVITDLSTPPDLSAPDLSCHHQQCDHSRCNE